VGLVLVKELLLVDEDVGVKISDLRLRELPFLRCAAAWGLWGLGSWGAALPQVPKGSGG
jgi:hypothetical protein